MERLLHYVWKYKLYPATNLRTTNNIPVTVIDVGLPNQDAGPDFFNTKLKIGDTLWAGSVEIHQKSSDWFRHNHHKDKNYDSVILHITEEYDKDISRTNGEHIPQLILTVPEAIRKNIDWLLHKERALPCHSFIPEIESVYINSWLAFLLTERMERKVNDITQLLENFNQDWNEVFYILLTRNFGFGINSDAFERLAKSLPLRCIQKQRNSQSQIEAMLLGQAGLLEEDYPCYYFRFLKQEYQFLQKKFNLQPLEKELFKRLRTRPENFPHVRLAQLAAIWCQHDTLFSAIREAGCIRQIKDYFRIKPSDYWRTHYHFEHFSPEKEKNISEHSINILLINTIAPLFFAWGQQNKQPEYCDRANRILEALPPEQNAIVSSFAKAGIQPSHAGDTQALIQLKRAYCEQKKCLYCQIGFRLLKRTAALK